jgi:signal-transduction protein with cAMP-binding, CBS, and nucleotidyltransferase domain
LCINKVIEEFSDDFLDQASKDQPLDKVNAKKHYFLEALLSQLTKHLESSNAWRTTSSKEKITQNNKTLFSRTSLTTLPDKLENLLRQYRGKAIKRVHYNKGDTIIKSGTYADALYVLKKGSYFVSFNNNVRSDVISTAYRVFGETCLLEEKRNATIYSNEGSDIYKITTDGINELKRKNAGIWRLIIYSAVVQRLEWIHDNRQNFID